MNTGLKHTSQLTVSDCHLACHLGSGDLEVLATPAMLALMENAAMLAVAPELEPGQGTVGSHIESSHLAPSPLGATITATAELTSIEGRKLSFHVCAFDGDRLIGEGSHTRFIIDRERFMKKLSER